MKRRDFLRRLAGAAAAPAAIAVGLAKPKADVHTEMARRCFGTMTGRFQSRTPNLANCSKSVNFLRAYGASNHQIICTMERNGFRYVGHVHDRAEMIWLGTVGR